MCVFGYPAEDWGILMILSHSRLVCAAYLLAGFVWCVSSRLAAQQSPLWGDLSPGPYAVGFKTVERYDYARVTRYKQGVDGSPRHGERTPSTSRTMSEELKLIYA